MSAYLLERCGVKLVRSHLSVTVIASRDWWTNFGQLRSFLYCCKSSKCLASHAGVFRKVVLTPSSENAFEKGSKLFGQAMARNLCDNKEKYLSDFQCRSRRSWGGKMDLKRSTISTTTMIIGACYSPLCSGGKEKLSLGWSADAPFSCSVSWSWAASTRLLWV